MNNQACISMHCAFNTAAMTAILARFTDLAAAEISFQFHQSHIHLFGPWIWDGSQSQSKDCAGTDWLGCFTDWDTHIWEHQTISKSLDKVRDGSAAWKQTKKILLESDHSTRREPHYETISPTPGKLFWISIKCYDV